VTSAGGDVAVERATVWLYYDNAKYTTKPRYAKGRGLTAGKVGMLLFHASLLMPKKPF